MTFDFDASGAEVSGAAARPAGVTLLVGIDGSETSLRAGSYAAGLASHLNARLLCLFVHSTSVLANLSPSAVALMQQTQRDLLAQLRASLERDQQFLRVPVTLVERTGNPYRELVKLADALQVDGVIVGASMQAGHRLIGSLAVHLVREARWPVTVVP